MKSKEFNKKLKDLSVEELKNRLSELSAELIKAKFSVSLNNEKNVSKLSTFRRNIARTNTEISKRLKTTN